LTQAIRQVEKKGSRIRDRYDLGRRIAELLAGAWRDSARTADRGACAGSPLGAAGAGLTLSETDLMDIVPQLCESGAGALAWWRIRQTPLAKTESGRLLHEVYRRFRLSALIHEREIACVLSLLRAEGIEPVLVKGWAIARLYPDPGLRPYGDIDLCVRPDQFAKASAALRCLEDIKGHYVDLHCGFSRIGQTKAQDGTWQDVRGSRRFRGFRIKHADMRVWDELFNRSHLVPLGSGLSEPGAAATELVRILCDEDHLRLLSLHLLRSGARRPPWLCDVALLLESLNFASRAKDFNWEVCVGQGLERTANRNRSSRSLNWIAMTIGLAQQLLGANVAEIESPRLSDPANNLPRWLVPAVLVEWGRRDGSPAGREGVARSLVDLYARWDNPVRATAAVGGLFNNWPRLPYRVGESFLRIPEVPRQLVALVEQFAVRPPSREVRSESHAGPARWGSKLRLTEE
jgi:Uncharacterised nucleotidyltransferase